MQISLWSLGISTSCGIPDFRSKSGLYNLIANEALPPPPSSTPSTPSDSTLPSSQASTSSQQSLPASRLRDQDLFNASVWKDSSATAVFYQFITSLRQKIKEEAVNTSWSHRFIRAFRDDGRLGRCYTQNIDGLDARDGLETNMGQGTGSRRRLMRKTFQEPRPSQTLSTNEACRECLGRCD